MITLEFLLVALIFTGAAAAMLRAIWLRREAVSFWRASAGGKFDAGQCRFVTDLDLDRARLPANARAKLAESRKALVQGSIAGLIAAVLLFWVTASHA
ncbi:MAG: hypothetical protein AB7M12_05600 [Hyphomonadaceae bacterium]